MTVRRAAFLFCDGLDELGRGCDATLDYSTIPSARTADEARAEGRTFGWHPRPGGRDLCPGCWGSGQR